MSELPIGEYSGHVISPTVFRLFNLVWYGKYFRRPGEVLNHILGFWLFKGEVIQQGERVFIHYKQLGLIDVLRKTNEGYLGTLDLFGITIKFRLTEKIEIV